MTSIQNLLPATHRASKGENIRQVCHRHYGSSSSEILDSVLAANPAILTRLKLIAGEIIVLPAIDVDSIIPPYVEKIWDDALFLQAAVLAVPKKVTKVSKDALLEALEEYRRKRDEVIPDEDPPEPRPPLPYGTSMDFDTLDDPFSLFRDFLTNLN